MRKNKERQTHPALRTFGDEHECKRDIVGRLGVVTCDKEIERERETTCVR